MPETINELPKAILVEILIQLPLKTIVHSKSVCKFWYEIISSQEFTKCYLANHTFLLSETRPLSSEFLSLLDIGMNGDIITSVHVCIPQVQDLEIIGCCNGFVCLARRLQTNHRFHMCYRVRKEEVYILNPLSGKYVVLPPTPTFAYGYTQDVHYGFGFSSSSDCYKIVRILHGFCDVKYRFGRSMYCEVFTMWKDASWRPIKDIALPKYVSSCGINVNGFLNWIGQDESWDWFIYAFSIDEEVGHRILLPHDVEDEFYYDNDFECYDGLENLQLTIWNNKLCFTDFKWAFKIDIWTMKEYGVIESWTKDMIILKTWIPSDLHTYLFIPVTTFRNGEILMCDLNSGKMISLDPEGKQSREIEVCGAKGAVFAHTYVPSF